MNQKFNNAVIFSGGGTRLVVYLGMFAALEKLGIKPDVIIASCGGAFAATVINAFPDNFSRKQYVQSEEYYQFVSNTKLTNFRKLHKIGLLTLSKIRNNTNAPFIEDVFSRYLVEMNQDLSVYFPSLKNVRFSQEIPTVIVGSEILFNPSETSKKRNERKLYRKVFFTDSETENRINPELIFEISDIYKKSTIDNNPKIETKFSMLESTRVSISDMFYVAPAFFDNRYFAGGAIDLIPIELAKSFSNNIFYEKKQIYSKTELAFVRSVLGYDGNQRLQEIENTFPDFQIDMSSIKSDLKGHYLEKNIDWKRFQIDFLYPKNYQSFKEDIEKQWQYGFNLTIKSLKTYNQ